MRVIFKSHGIKIKNDLKSYAEKKILKLKSLITEPAVCEISVFCRVRGGQNKIIKIVLSLPSHKKPIYAESCSGDFISSIDLAQDSLETQLVKFKEKKNMNPRFPVKYWAERVIQIGMAGPKWLIKKSKKGPARNA